MHIHTCPTCSQMFESTLAGTSAECERCLAAGPAFDEDAKTEPRIRRVSLETLRFLTPLRPRSEGATIGE